MTSTLQPPAGAAWKLRFFSIFSGQALSLVGSAMTQFVLVWWITQTTGSAGALATAGIMALLPQALLGPIGGTVADRYDRRTIMIVADAITAGCMLVLIALFATEQVQLWQVYALMFIRSSMQAFQSPAAAASTSMLVPEPWLPRAAGLNQTVQGMVVIAAAPLGALAMATMPLQGALMIDVVTALCGIVPLLFFRIPQVRTPKHERQSAWVDFLAGFRFVRQQRGLAALFAVLGLVVLTVMPTFMLTPLLVKEHFAGGIGEVAMMEGISGIGMIAGGLVVSLFPLFRRRIVTVLLGYGLSCAAVAFTAAAPGTAFWLAVAWWTVSGVAFSIGNAPLTAILQTVVPNQMQGRVLALMGTVMGLAGPIGLVIVGPLAEAIGVRGAFIVGGSLSALVCLGAFAWPSLMRLEDRPEPEAVAPAGLTSEST